MRVDRFVSANYRNIADGEIAFGTGLNLFLGPNGQGKTNLLESIYYFRAGRSFRAQTDAELVRFGATFCRVELECSFDDTRRERFAFAIELRNAHSTKTIKIDGDVLPRRSDLAGRFPVVLFGPNDLRTVSGEPEHRRRFFDMIGVMIDPGYRRASTEYRRVLEQRNAALKARASRDELAAWNERLVSSGVELLTKRRDLVAAIEREVTAQARELASPFAYALRYESTLVEHDATASSAHVAQVFHEQLTASAGEEIRRGITSVGPHRDDVVPVMDGHDLRRYGSQGQRRLLAVLLKLAELAHIETELREPCVLLLDDVFSEFDESITGKLHHLLDAHRQVFVTSPVPIRFSSTSQARVYHVDAGRVSRASRGSM